MTPEKILLLNLIARLGLRAALVIWEQVESATTDKDAVAQLKARLLKTPQDFIDEDLARRQQG